jgi:isoleucyl-tRNA synthetase
MLSKIKSVHLQDFPNVANLKDEKELIADMDMIRDICSSALSIRDKKNLRVRLPLNKLVVIGKNVGGLKKYQHIIADEINVKNVEFKNEIGDLAEFKLQLDFKKLGAKLGGKMKDVIVASKKGEWKKLPNNEIKIGGIKLTEEDYSLNLIPKNTDSTGVLSTNDALVELDIVITEELKLEGLARDIVRLIQQNRKEADLNISDKIHLFISTDNEEVKKAINANSTYIKEQTLSTSIEIGDKKGEFNFENKIENGVVKIGFEVAK